MSLDEKWAKVIRPAPVADEMSGWPIGHAHLNRQMQAHLGEGARSWLGFNPHGTIWQPGRFNNLPVRFCIAGYEL